MIDIRVSLHPNPRPPIWPLAFKPRLSYELDTIESLPC